MKLSDFNFILPKELIASFPPSERPSAKLLCVDRAGGNLSHRVFRDLTELLKPGDLLVLNNTKVRAARIFGQKESGGKVEALLLKELEGNVWKALLRPGGRIREGSRLTFGTNGCSLVGAVLDSGLENSGERLVRFEGEDVRQKLGEIGHIPLPPYIDRPDCEIDREVYQTVFAKHEGAVASPTAGLHFDKPLLAALEKKGIETAYVTLHVSYATFQPIVEEDLTRHKMMNEEYEITPEAQAKIEKAFSEKRRIIACGTTTTRALESAATEKGKLRAGKAETRLFIYPSYEFKIISGLITNFHLPKSTLLLLVAAFLAGSEPQEGRAKLFRIYEEAIRSQYKFYSYGDAMVVL